MTTHADWIDAMHPQASRAERRAIERELAELDRLERTGKTTQCHSTDPSAIAAFLRPGRIYTEAELTAYPTARHPWPPTTTRK